MGFIANVAQKSAFAKNIHTFEDWFEPLYTDFFKHQPQLTPPPPSMVEKAKGLAKQLRDSGKAKHAAGFAERTQLGFPAWVGPPGPAENRPFSPNRAIPAPEETRGELLNESS